MIELPNSLTSLQEQLLNAAQKFATDSQPLSELLTTLVNDVARADAEPLELFPVCHHSPSSALQMVQRLHQKPPKVIYLEMCEDLMPAVDYLRDCKLPVALQAFAAESDAFPPEFFPLSVVTPLTEASAEYQAIAFSLQHPGIELVFVDRAVDFVFQWQPPETEKPEEIETIPPSEEAKMHGAAVGIEVGRLMPTLDNFIEFLLHNSKTRHYAEWWDQYVEQAIIGSDYQTYRQVMFLIGSLMRRLGSDARRLESDRLREQYMWTRIKEHLKTHNISPEDAIYICGAFHTVSDVEEFGIESASLWDIPPRTNTPWLYGLLPSSFAAIEYQFSHPPGTISLAESTWKKSLKVAKVKPFTLDKSQRKSKVKPSSGTPKETEPELLGFLTRSPEYAAADEEQLLDWCTRIVALARENAYLSSTADAIAIYQTSILLANMRNRLHPTPYDFQDAAITCLEKDRTPKKRNIQQICQILLGGDRVGSIGYNSLPPLAQNIYDRLEPIEINLQSKTVQRALMDLKKQPELLPCSNVLWRLNYLIGDRSCKPIMGERTLGSKPIQESWEIYISKYQGDIIMLAYEGVTIEQVLEQRLKKKALAADAKTSITLEAAEDSILYLNSLRLTQELGYHAISLLSQETGAEDAPSIFDRIRRLVYYYRSQPTGLPDWIKIFVATGYSHYATLLPQTFGDRGTSPEQIAGMLNFIFTLESLALSLGCNRSQLLISIQQAEQELDDAAKLGLLWTAQWLLQKRSLAQMREFFEHVLTNSLLTPRFPDYLNGFILALNFAPRISQFVVELLSKVFASIPDTILLPWLPNLILKLRPHAQVLQALIKEASLSFPKTLVGFENWQAPWVKSRAVEVEKKPQIALNEEEIQVRQLLFDKRETTEAIAQLLGVEDFTWSTETESANIETVDSSGMASESELQIKELLEKMPATMQALANLLS